jgi:phage baseplate assembly protein W
MAYSKVQTAGFSPPSVAEFVTSGMANFAVGDMIVLQFAGSRGAQISSITGGGVTAWTRAVLIENGEKKELSAEIWFGVIATGGVNNVITVKFTKATTAFDPLVVTEWLGGAGTLQVAAGSEGHSTAIATPPETPTTGGELCVATTRLWEQGVTAGPPAGWTALSNAGHSGNASAFIIAGTGPQQSAWTTAPADWSASVIAVFPAALTITKPAAQTNTVGIPINGLQVEASGLTEYKATGLPTGYIINPVTGLISGTPNKVESPTVTLKAKGPGGEVETTFVWNVVSVATAATWQGYTAFSPIPQATPLGSATCAFNRQIGQSRVLPNSAEMVAWLLADSPLGTASHAKNHFPTVYATSTDPQVEILDAAKGFFDKKKIRIPVASKCQANGDHHLQVVLCPTDCAALAVPEGSTADFWQVKATGETIEYEEAGKKLKVSSSGLGNMTGSLLGGNSVAANYDLNAGVIRGPELAAGQISHALVAFVHNCRKAFVYPANHTDGEENGLPVGLPAYAPVMGQRFYLAMTDAEIEALGLPHPFLVAVAKAIAKYGFYIEDTGDTATGFRLEDGAMYSAFGARDMVKVIGEEQGLVLDGEGFKFDWSPLAAAFSAHLQAVVRPAAEGSPTPTITKPAEQHGTVGTAVSRSIAATGVTTFEAQGLPEGLAINPVTGVVTGTPTAAGSSTVTIIGKGAETEVTTTFPWAITVAAETQFAVRKPDAPHFAQNFTIGREGAAVVEQDSPDDIAACVYRIAVCPQGFRDDRPAFGRPQLPFKPVPLDLAALEAAITFWEPRADLTATQQIEAVTGGVAVEIDVS